MSSILSNAARRTPPVLGGNDFVVLASSTSAAVFRVPDHWKTGYVDIEPQGCDCFYRVVVLPKTAAAPTAAASASAVTTLSSGAVSSQAAGVSVRVPADGSDPIDLSLLNRDYHVYIDHVESAGSAFVRIRRTGGPGKTA